MEQGLKRIVVIGLGQIGGSIVLGLRRNHAPYYIVGVDTSRKRLKLLKNFLDEAHTNSKRLGTADLILLCTHYDEIRDFLQTATRNQLCSDVCSGKAKLLQFANQRKLRFIGGHPMTGNEFAQEKGWRANLFEGSPYFLCPGKFASRADLRTIRKLVWYLGAHALPVDAQTHDRFVSITSHFPAFVSRMFYEMGKETPDEFKGPGFQSTTRLAKTSAELLNTFVQSNRENIVANAKKMQKQLDKLIQLCGRSDDLHRSRR